MHGYPGFEIDAELDSLKFCRPRVRMMFYCEHPRVGFDYSGQLVDVRL